MAIVLESYIGIVAGEICVSLDSIMSVRRHFNAGLNEVTASSGASVQAEQIHERNVAQRRCEGEAGVDLNPETEVLLLDKVEDRRKYGKCYFYEAK